MAVLQQTVLLLTSLYYGIKVLIDTLEQVVSYGFRQTFSWKPHQKPVCLDDPTLGTHGFLHLQDVRIHYVASGPENKQLMLFVHGFPEFWYSWRYQIREFQKDYRVVAIDMRGYGDSDKPKGIDAYAVDKLARDIIEVILALGYKSCTLVGHDWGAAVAWSVGKEYPDAVDRLIIMNVPPSTVFRKVLSERSEQKRMSWYMFFFQLPYLPELYMKVRDHRIFDVMFGGKGSSFTFVNTFKNPLNTQDVEAYKYTFSQPGALTPPLNFYRWALGRGSGRRAYDVKYSMPVLVVWGMKDVFLSSSFPDAIEQANPRFTVKRIHDAGHFVQMDTPELVNKTVRDWLKDHGTE